MSIAIMRFRAGAHRYAVAAGCVEAVGPVRPGAPHLASLLERTSGTGEDGARTLQLVAHGHRVDVTVDGPVEVLELAREAIAPCRATLSSNVLGFARLDGEVFALLDTERLVELVRESAIESVAQPELERLG